MNISGILNLVMKLSTSKLSDALDYFSLPGCLLHDIKPITCIRKIVGNSWIIRYIPVTQGDPGTVGDYIEQVVKKALDI